MSSQVKCLYLNETTKQYQAGIVDSNGALKTVASFNTTGLATDANQVLILSDTGAIKTSVASMDSKMSNLATEATLALVATESTQQQVKTSVDAVNTTLQGTLAVGDASALVKLTSIDSSISGVLTIAGTELNVVEQSASSILADTTAIKVSASSIDTKLSSVATESTLSTVSGTLTTMSSALIKADTDNCVITSGSITETNSASILANTNTLASTVSAGKVQVQVVSSTVSYSRGNISNNATILTQAVSASSVSVSGFEKAHLFIEDATVGQTQGYSVEASVDNGSNWETLAVLFMEDNYAGTKRWGHMEIECKGLTTIRVRNLAPVSVANVIATLSA